MSFRKLTLAILVVGLVFAFVGTAFAEEVGTAGSKQRKVDRPGIVNPDARLIDQLKVPNYLQEPALKIAPQRYGPQHDIPDVFAPATEGTDTTGCTWIRYWTGSSFFVDYNLAGASQGTAVAMRYDYTSSGMQAGELTQVLPWFNGWSEIDGAGLGPQMVVSVYDDNGGIPGELIGEETFDRSEGVWLYYPSLPYGVGYARFYPTIECPPVFHVVISTTGGNVADEFWLESNDGGPSCTYWWDDDEDPGTPDVEAPGDGVGTFRGSYYDGSIWQATSTAFCGDMDFLWYAAFCYWYTECYSTSGAWGGYVWDPLPMPYEDFDGSGTGPTWNGYGMLMTNPGDSLSLVRVNHYDESGYYGQIFWPDAVRSMTVKVWPDDAGEVDMSDPPMATSTLTDGRAAFFPATGGDQSAEGWNRIFFDFTADDLVFTGNFHVTADLGHNTEAEGQLFMGTSLEHPAYCDPEHPDYIGVNPYCSDATGGSVSFDQGASYTRMMNSTMWMDNFGIDMAAWFRVYFCLDEFSECQTVYLHDLLPPAWDPLDPDDFAYYWPIYFAGVQQYAQLVKGSPVNRVETIRLGLNGWDWNEDLPDWPGYAIGPVSTPVRGVIVNLYEAGGYGPGDVFWADTIETATYIPGWTEVVIPGGLQVVGDFYVGFAEIPEDFVDGIGITGIGCSADAGTCEHEQINGGIWRYRTGTDPDPDYWQPVSDHGWDDNLIIEVDMCSLPVLERPCFAETGMPMFGHDMFRTGAQGIALGDPDCNLNLEWHYFNANAPNRNAPTIYDGKIVMGIMNGYVVLDLATGAQIEMLELSDGPIGSMGLLTRGTPMIVTAEVDDPLDPGTSLGVIDFILCPTASTMRVSAYKWGTWEYLWSSDWSGANVRYANFVVLDDVLYYSNENAELLAVNLYDGSPFAGWDGVGGSIDLGLNCVLAGCTDGTSLFYGTLDYDALEAGDIYMIDPADGTILDYFTQNNDLEVPAYWTWITPEANTEGFAGSFSYDAEYGLLYANSDCNGAAQDTGDPPDGVYYAIEMDYEVDPPVMTTFTSAYGQRTLYTGPIIDYSRVIVPTNSVWVQAPLDGNVVAFRRPQGDADWVGDYPVYEAGHLGQPALSCEEGVRDIFVGGCGGNDAFYEGGFLGFFNADNGDRMFYRKVENGNANFDQVLGVSLGVASVEVGEEEPPVFEDVTYLVTADIFGSIYGFKHGPDNRARLEIQDHLPQINVSFGSAIVPGEFTDILYNSGCAGLNIDSITIDPDTEAEGTSVPDFSSYFEGVRPDVASAATSIATRMTSSHGGKANLLNPSAGLTGSDDLFARATKTDDVSRKAAVITDMAWLVDYPLGTPLSYPTFINPKAYGSIGFFVDQSVLDRGPHEFFLTIFCDDPDYFINDVSGKVAAGYPPGDPGYQALKPRIFGNVVGGCIMDTTTLHFGMDDGENFRLVYNMARLGTGDFATSEGGVGNFNVDGAGAELYAGSYIYGIDRYRLAMNARDWTGGGGETNGFYSAQGDPNWCDNDCKPAMLSDVVMGQISSDGFDYTDVTGMMGAVTYVDSVFGYYDEGDAADDLWTWHEGWETGRMDDTLSIGLTVDQRVFGAINVQALSNVTLDVMDFTERNGDAVNGWYFGAYGDGDIGSDISEFNADISTGWQHGAGGVNAVCFTKIPFGAGYDPALGGVQMYGNQGLWQSDPYYDSTYKWMSNDGLAYGVGDFWGEMVRHPNTGDEQFHHTLAGHDFAGYGTFRMAVGISVPHGLTDGSDVNEIGPYAHLLNKWAGFGRGDVDDDNVLTIGDIIYLNRFVNDSESNPGPVPFMHLGDVDNDDDVDLDDVTQLTDYIINWNPAAAPLADWAPWTSTGCPQ